jgi:hypothetical protein
LIGFGVFGEALFALPISTKTDVGAAPPRVVPAGRKSFGTLIVTVSVVVVVPIDSFELTVTSLESRTARALSACPGVLR